LREICERMSGGQGGYLPVWSELAQSLQKLREAIAPGGGHVRLHVGGRRRRLREGARGGTRGGRDDRGGGGWR
jgi:hypothetical protein